MRALAQYVMRGPLQAGGVAAVTTAVPLLFWIGAAVIGLVILRLGIRQGLNIGLWALMPALGWAVYGQDPTSLVVLLQVMLMASILRTTLAWEKALLSGAFLAILSGLMLPVMYPALLNDLVQTGVSFYEQYNAEVARSLGSDLELIIRDTMNASMAGTYFATAVGMTMLARAWQAGLYNPGGFRKEFHALRLSPAIAVVCALTMVIGPVLGLNSMLLAWAAGTPLFIAALGLVHGVVGRKQLSGNWLAMFYLALVLLGPSLMLLLLVLAFVDSWLDIRGRIQPAGPAE
ncbi:MULTISPECIES: hypothetical protein [Marinobacter]|jgi:hypothetical protein|uniref:DUF2232 domain-containing protein n=2 Tax=Marinobacter TaxID=2742 RepID=A0A455W294_MARNT|nr:MULTISPECIES: hypothetical protein [Marinobacter]WBU42154.1 hypothetical protein PBN92_04430 [Marinobacter alkaliphilus]BBJ03000.1 hypothetical protein YBY_08480 [Marinobacter nauticus]AMQ90075.1 hypothetical protein ASQ50_16020 [Marinobacter sp. LQ44]MAO14709.1 hypothetical protein [Marinobacter sp.]MCD1630174.1 hypothetical protein [Marinobacter shengliensis]